MSILKFVLFRKQLFESWRLIIYLSPLMKSKLCHIVLVLGCLLLSPKLFAQESSESMEPELKSSYMPSGESQKFDARDSIYLRSTVPPKTSEPLKNSNNSGGQGTKEGEDDDSVLSFNFLYYIIQKYKMSDIVDP